MELLQLILVPSNTWNTAKTDQQNLEEQVLIKHNLSVWKGEPALVFIALKTPE